MNKIKSLVTGGAGFIGSNLVDELLNKNHEVIVIDDESSDAHEHFYYNDKAEYWNYDIFDYELIEPLFKNIDYVFHLAAESRIQPAVENPRLAVRTNVLGTCNILQAARENSVKRVIYSSTSSAYGLKNSIPNTEDQIKDCLNPYSVSKTSGEELCQMYTKLFGVETIIFRYFNVYGERQPTKGQYAPVIGLFQKQYSENLPMTVIGDGLQRRDFTHVSDVVNANIVASMVTEEDAVGEIYNIGSGVNYSVLDLVEMIGGDGYEISFLPERPGESRQTLSDCDKAKRYLGWHPKVNLKEWLQNSIGICNGK